MRSGTLVYAMFLASLLLFGSNGIAADRIDIPNAQMAFLRAGLAALSMICLAVIVGRRFRVLGDRRKTAFLVIAGAADGLSWIFLYTAYQMVGIGIATILYYMGPAMVIVLSPWLFRERLTARRVAGFLAVLCGAILLCVETADSDISLMGCLFGLASAGLNATMIVFSKKAPGVDGIECISIEMVAAFAMTFTCFALMGGGFVPLEGDGLASMLVMGIVIAGFGGMLYLSSITRLRAQTVVVCGYLEPLSAVVLGAIVLGESMSILQTAGVAAILLGAVYAETEGLRLRSRADGGSPATR